MKMEVGQKHENMGKPINTKESDKSPFIHTDSRTFYFVSESSDNRWGAGDFDIFYTQQNEETLFGTNQRILDTRLIAKNQKSR